MVAAVSPYYIGPAYNNFKSGQLPLHVNLRRVSHITKGVTCPEFAHIVVSRGGTVLNSKQVSTHAQELSLVGQL